MTRCVSRWIRAAIVLSLQLVATSGSAGQVGFSTNSGQGEATRRVTTRPIHRPVSLDMVRRPLADALREISRQSGLRIVYADALVRPYDVVTIRMRNVPAGAALRAAVANTTLDLVIEPDGEAAALRAQLAVSPSGQNAQRGDIRGQVTDAKTGQGVTGAEILLEGTRWGTSTDTAGWYRLMGVDSGTYTLTARRLGYAKHSRRVLVRAAQEDTVNMVLTPLATKLDELITTATGQQRRRDLGNAITTIRADSVLQSAPIRNLTDLLENRVPGLTVQHTSGAPGDPARLRLRGLGSVMRSNDPVVIVDGVRIYATQSAVRSGNLTNVFNGGTNSPAPSPLDQIDPNVIETIEVFKGPSAATLYGADAANGVIVITTKQGRPGPARWNIAFTHRRTNTLGQYAEGYYNWGHTATDNVPRFCPLVDLTCEPDSLVRFQALNDPELTLLGQGRGTGLSLSVSGGNQALTYSVTGTYDDEIGLLQLPGFEAERFRVRFGRTAPDWMQRPHHLEKWSVRSSLKALLSSTMDVTLSTSLSRSEQQRSTLEQQLADLAGTYVDKVNGIYYVTQVGPANNGEPNAMMLNGTGTFLEEYYKRTIASGIMFTTGLNASWRPRSWFTARGDAGLNVVPRNDQVLLPAGLVPSPDSGLLIQGTGRSLVSTVNLQGAVRKPLGWGVVFETSVGANLSTTSTVDLMTQASELVPGTGSVNGARIIQARDAEVSTSVFGWYIEPRIVGQRLSLSTGIRLDGGSTHGARLSQGGGVGKLLSLPKLNGSWVISEEPFFPFRSFFSSLRLRGAYGQAQVQPGPADRLRLYRYATTNNVELTDSLGNTHLLPERSVEIEGGFDAEMLDSKVVIELTAYRKTKVDALMVVRLPESVNGGGSVITNIGNIRNTGVELSLGLTPVRLPDLTWSARLNYARNDNKLVKLGRGVLPNAEQGFVAGYPVGGRWVRPILGYDDQNRNGVIDRAEVLIGDSTVFMGRILPNNVTSLFTDISLLGGAVGISAGFSYQSGATQLDRTARFNWVFARGLVDPNASAGEQAAVLATTNQSPYTQTDYGIIQNISTFRFNSLSVNARVPARVAQIVRARRARVAVQGSNLGLYSSYRGKDPDVTSWTPGEGILDTGQMPLPRTWQLRVDLEY